MNSNENIDINGIDSNLYNKLVKHFLKKKYHVPVIANRPLVCNKKDFIEFNSLKGVSNSIIDDIYENYLKNISKFCPTDLLVSSKMIDDRPGTIIHYMKYRVNDFDAEIKNYITKLIEKDPKQVRNYIDHVKLKNLSPITDSKKPRKNRI